MIYDQTKQSFQSNLSKLYDSQEQQSSGLKINRPSDDTIGMQKVFDYKLTLNYNEQYKKNMDDAQSLLDSTDSVLSEMTNNLQRISELMIDASNGSRGPVDRQDIAQEISVLKDELYNLSNSKLGDRYLFSGFNNRVSSYATNANGTYSYLGDANHVKVDTSLTGQVIENVTGTDAFAISMAPQSMRLDSGNFASFTSVASSAQITMVFSTSSDPSVTGYDQVSFTNYMDMVNEIVTALDTNNTERLSALQKCVALAIDNTTSIRATVGARLSYINSAQQTTDNSTSSTNGLLSTVQDADMTEVFSNISKSEVALQALRQTSSQILSQSLLDFLK
ncbi:MAG: flagellar hook-associated protein FlgL [Nitrospirae bacterium]|nr:flagellar hook-associated protein FlgL [Nitrospirota bacterium]MBF0591022.1 flagellar hook-associated protein FlgL [Nitrospirota bacterium]